ncbi:hypothetical protein PC116_g25373 [Phytophthora cactorum]|nr:hypothetical protein Pcac1_g11514 [Phytophthora cactorum]KAG4226217.1 hypothetical protein PC116_g25373 [Phytophthora cactorum]
MFVNGKPGESSLVPAFMRRSFVDDVCFGGKTFDNCLETLIRLLTRFAGCRISISFTKSIFLQPKVDFLSHEVAQRGMQADTKMIPAIAELPFPNSKKGMQTFLGALNYYGRFIRTLVVYDAVLDQLKDDDFGPGGDPTSAKAPFPELKKRVTETPILRQFDSAKEVHIIGSGQYTHIAARRQAAPSSVLWMCVEGE